MIVLLSCSISWCKANSIDFSTGELKDSVTISYDALRVANSKMVELIYQKEINDSLKSIIRNNDIIIKVYNNKVIELNKEIKKTNKKNKTIKFVGLVITLLLSIGIIVK